MNSSGVNVRQVRITPRQGSFDTSGSKNIVDFSVPSSNYDLSKSSLVIRTKVNHVSNEPVVNGTGDDSGIFDSAVLMNDSADAHYTFATQPKKDILVKNGRCETSKMGVIDNVVRHNAWKSNLNALMMSEDQQDNEITFGSTLNARNKGLTFSQPIDLLFKEGTRLSEQRPVEIELPLKSVFSSNVVENFQSSVHGDLSYHLELRLDKMSANSIVAPDSFWTTEYNNGTDAANNALYGEFEDVAAPGADTNVSTLTTKISYKNLEDSPFHTGQKLKISYTLQGSAPVVDQVCKVVSISQKNTNDANTGKLDVTFDGFIVNQTNGNTLTAITVKGLTATSNSLVIEAIELKMMELINAPAIKTPQTLTYNRIRTHNDTYTQTQHQTRNYYIPPRTKAVWVCFPEDGANRSASKDAITNYRVIVDNVPLTETPVLYNSTKHHDLMRAGMMTAGDSEYPLKNLRSQMKDWNFPEDDSGNINVKFTVLCFPVKFKAERSVLNLELEASANLSGQIQLMFQTVEQVIVK